LLLSSLERSIYTETLRENFQKRSKTVKVLNFTRFFDEVTTYCFCHYILLSTAHISSESTVEKWLFVVPAASLVIVVTAKSANSTMSIFRTKARAATVVRRANVAKPRILNKIWFVVPVETLVIVATAESAAFMKRTSQEKKILQRVAPVAGKDIDVTAQRVH